ncbi:MAG: RsmB/NOP family class I SAM-dependent RNA methyltransferase [Eubacteriales bacterium]|nr:RsmB/NOP family class I SAM-dependent RNA methyltransferase [Eubacteriales bacterium]
MRLPEKFTHEMIELWQQFHPPGTLDSFLAAQDERAAGGLRINTLKLSPQDYQSRFGSQNQFAPIPWCETGLYYPANFAPGRQAEYFAGLYYIQEPSAMLPAEVLAIQPGDRVLDLCAAPGGKSTRLAELTGRNGLLWANEINSERVKALLRNIELMGIDRSIITNETPERLASQLPGFFDRILVDAPCSGSGMFRRDAQATTSWEKYGPDACVVIQRDILESADQMLKPGGYLVYSTCSFSVSEDEQMIAEFLDRHSDYQIIPCQQPETVSPGLGFDAQLTLTSRIWPHIAQGDGHFCALLQKRHAIVPQDVTSPTKLTAPLKDPRLQLFREWLDSILSKTGQQTMARREDQAYYRIHQDHLHLVPQLVGNMANLRYVKTGLYLGEFRLPNNQSERSTAESKQTNRQQAKGKFTKTVSQSTFQQQTWRFEPGHAFLLTLKASDIRFSLRLAPDDPTVMRYLRGETITWPEADWPSDGWPHGAYVAVCLDEFPLGWAKAGMPGQLKNNYPAGWRKLN